MKKSFKRFGSYQKTSYLCTRFDEDNTSRMRKFLGRFDDEKKSFKKIWRFEKLALPLHHFPLKNGGQECGEDREI